MSASVGAAVAIMRMNFDTDVRAVLALVSAPTLVVRADRRPHDPGGTRPLPGRAHRRSPIHRAPRRRPLLLGGGHGPDLRRGRGVPHRTPLDPDADRVLCTILFTDIVDSTRRAADLGDRRWRGLLDDTTPWSTDNWSASGDGYQEHRRWGSSPPSTVPPGRSGAPVPYGTAPDGWAWRSAPGCTPASVRSETTTWPASPSMSVLGSGVGRPGEVLVSRTVVDLVAGSGIEFTDRGDHDLKGVPGTWRLFAVRD